MAARPKTGAVVLPQKTGYETGYEKNVLTGGVIQCDDRCVEYSLFAPENPSECLVVHIYGGEDFPICDQHKPNPAVMTAYLSHVDATPYASTCHYNDYDVRYLKLLQEEIIKITQHLDAIYPPYQKKILSGDGLGGLLSLLIATHEHHHSLFDGYIAKVPLTTKTPAYSNTGQYVETSGDQYQHLFYPEWSPLLNIHHLEKPTLVLDWTLPSDHSLRFFEKGLLLNKPVYFYMLDNLIFRHAATPVQRIEEFLKNLVAS